MKWNVLVTVHFEQEQVVFLTTQWIEVQIMSNVIFLF